MQLNEIRKEDDLYYRGLFWIIADSYKDIQRGNFELLGKKYPTDYEGKRVKEAAKEERLTHKQAWVRYYQNQFHGKDYSYYPRGRVEIFNGVAYVNLNSLCNTPRVIDRIVETYNLDKIELDIEYNDLTQGNHYDFLLK